jgi:DNA-directed RNA polymerase alpha subunit
MFDLLPQSIIDSLFTDSDNRPRDLDILECRLRKSATLKELAQKHGLCKERIRQIEMKGRRVITWHLKKMNEAWEKQGELVATIKALEAEVDVLRKLKEVISPYISEDKPTTPIVPIEDLRYSEMMSVRLYQTLRNAGINTLNEAAVMLEDGGCQLLKIKNFGKLSLAMLKELVVKYGLTGEKRG